MGSSLVCTHINPSKINSSKRFISNINNNIDNLLQYFLFFIWNITIFEYDHELCSFVWPWNIVINSLLWDKFWYYLQLTNDLNLIDVKLRNKLREI